MKEYLIIFFRAAVTYLVLVVLTRLMGRKQISQLTYFDYVVGITIGSIAAVASIDPKINMSQGIFSIIVWGSLTILISEITLKNIKLRLWIDSEPLLIIENGKVIYKNMKKARYNMGDLLMQLRDKNIFYITDVEIAILEPNGTLSVLKKADQTELTAKDMKIQKPKTGMMVDLILNGKILYSHLSQINKNEDWVISQLKARNIHNIKDVVFAGIQADEQIYIVTKDY
ncbi:DUF421 domain-containing protein [Clostridium botulinum]|uniref:DUF421 domain-containing protein n=1 Tax=Clostridium botulinum TaxID=1491 RepID=A0A846J928_CLOBO|nr:DUF421 domain-containing protein [Clostridium botulinum]ACA55343.1 membrane protein of ydfr family [Clostridium botulinum A3 str. Loch Maree]NFH65121.1 DUF421 domain-containing protein [Clostridium botulinum]NFJ10052.1 DUF421 domain-containing protein [Clostridium botulinum]NFK15389.1 DUF421 domain-containing protein [Clostridium botulinum]NFM95196.1 DUF421 domain-containing protein [Clostridium botulinum]